MKAVVALVLATLMWAGNYVVGGIVVEFMSPVELTWFRWLLAAIPLLVLAHVLERPRWRAVLAEWPRLLILAVLGVGAYTLLLYSALQFTTALSASLINAANPAVMAVLSAVLLRERIGWRGVAGLLLGLVGVLLVITDGALSVLFSNGLNPGDVMMVGAILVWSLYTILGRGLSAPPVTATAVQAVFTVVLLAPVVLVTGAHWPDRADTLTALLFIAIFPSIGAYALWNLALTRVTPGRAGLFLNLITVFTVIISVAMGARLAATDVVGGLLVFAGVALSSLRRKPAEPAEGVGQPSGNDSSTSAGESRTPAGPRIPAGPDDGGARAVSAGGTSIVPDPGVGR